MRRAINSASIQSVLAKVPRLFPDALTCAGGSCRASIPAAFKLAQKLNSWPPAALKQTKASLSLATRSGSASPTSAFRRQWMPSRSRQTSMPMISGCDKGLMLSSFWFAVRRGRMQLCEMMKRGGVACSHAWSRQKDRTPSPRRHRPSAKVGDGSRIAQSKYRRR